MCTKVSVLMPVYNAEKYLSQAIESILSQSLIDFEFIIINDGSTDQSDRIIRSYTDERIKYYQNEHNIGLIRTLNKGIDLCTGEYIARMDSDDIALPNRLLLQSQFLDRNIKYGICGGDALVIDQNGKETGKIKNPYTNELLKINLLFSVPFIHPAIMLRREVFDHLKYDESYKHVEDYDLWCRVAKEWKIANIPENVLLYRWHESNVSVIYDDEQEKLKKQIIIRELKQLNLEPSPDEIYAHQITFKLYSKGKKQNIDIQNFKLIDEWFDKLISKNKTVKIYNKAYFIAYLWARWTVLCISQNKISRIIPSFTKLKPQIIVKWLELVYFLAKK